MQINLQLFKKTPRKRGVNTKLLKQRLEKLHVVAIIPAFNEEKRISTVLNIVCKYPYIDEIIVVDDGSEDNTYALVKNISANCLKLKVYKLRKNQGKTKAMLHGVQKAKSADILVFLDADLKNLPKDYIDKMLYYLVSGQYDMTILDRLSDRKGPMGILALARFFGGERAVWKKDFVQIDFSKTQGYEIESTINLWYLKNNKRVRTIFAPKLHSEWQFKKWGTIKALQRYLDMFWRIYKKYGLKNFYMQVLEFDDDTLEELYSWYKKQKQKKYGKALAKTAVTLGVILGTAGVMTWAFGYDLLNKIKQSTNEKQKSK